MITLTAKINLLSGDEDNLSVSSVNLSKNNVSSLLGDIIGVKRQVNTPFIFGFNKFGDNSVVLSKVNYFIGGNLSNANGEFETPYTFTISGNAISSLTFAFDTSNNRHPNTIEIDGVTYYDDDATFTVKLNEANSHTIKIDNWNTPNAPFVVSGIYININIDINYRSLISLNRNITYRADDKLPSYGIISNTGRLEFNDLNGEIKDYAEQLFLTSDLRVVINLNNTLTNAYEKVGVFSTKEWDYDNINRIVSVTLKDDLEEWQDIQVQGFNYDPREPFKIIADGKISNIYKWLQGQDEKGKYRTPQKYEMLSFEELDQKTKDILENTIIQYPLLESGTLWEQWQKVCEVCGLYIYKNNEGKTICTYTYGS